MRYFFLLLLIATSVGVLVTLVQPRYQHIQAIRKEVANSSTNLGTADKLQQSRTALLQTYNAIPKADLDNLKTLLPDSVNNIRLIIQINALANKNGLSVLRNVDYQSDQQKTATPTPPGSTADNRPYGEFTVSFETTGQYKNFLAFLSDLEQNLRLVDVTAVDFTVNDTATNTSLANSMTYKITLKTYWLKQ